MFTRQRQGIHKSRNLSPAMPHGEQSGESDRELPLCPSKTRYELNGDFFMALGASAVLWFAIGFAIRWLLFPR